MPPGRDDPAAGVIDAAASGRPGPAWPGLFTDGRVRYGDGMHATKPGGSNMLLERLTMPIGQVILRQRSVRKFKPDPIPEDVLHLLFEAAVRAPNGGNHQAGRFLLVTDRARIRDFAQLYHEAWWAKQRDEKRGWTRPEDIPPSEKGYRAA